MKDINEGLQATVALLMILALLQFGFGVEVKPLITKVTTAISNGAEKTIPSLKTP